MDFPIKHGGFFHSYVTVCQRVHSGLKKHALSVVFFSQPHKNQIIAEELPIPNEPSLASKPPKGSPFNDGGVLAGGPSEGVR